MSISITPTSTRSMMPMQPAPGAPRNPGVVPPSHQSGYHILPVPDTQFDPTPVGTDPIFTILPVED